MRLQLLCVEYFLLQNDPELEPEGDTKSDSEGNFQVLVFQWRTLKVNLQFYYL